MSTRAGLLALPALLAAVAMPQPAWPQRAQAATVRERQLPQPVAILEVEFTRIAAVRELSRNVALVLDAGERQMFVVDWTRLTATPLGRQGNGPGEYAGPQSLFELSGDSSVLIDVAGSRWLFLNGSRITGTTAPDDRAIAAGARTALGFDAGGYVYTTRAVGTGGAPAVVGSSFRAPDSTLLIRIARTGGRVDTVAKLRARPAAVSVQRSADGQGPVVSIVAAPLAVGEQIAVFPDGAVGIVRLDPFRVQWIMADGRTILGPVLPHTPVRVDASEKVAAVKRLALQRGSNQVDTGQAAWPATIPPFLSQALIAGRNGRLWLRRAASVARPATTYDVISRTGAIVDRVSMSERERIVGLGVAWIYTIIIDDDGIERLRRHPAR